MAKIPAGTTAIIGTVADNFPDARGHFRHGGNTQIFVPKVETFPFENCQFAGDKGNSGEIEIQSDDRSLWFRK
ncbi:MAG: hypothetical protein C5B51_07870 [Terriglobia bacterium]|nr:MAG: hypothetical protein C5B51_07870 [Terriglobia bacterium]